MSKVCKIEEVSEYCDLFYTYKQAMLDAGYKLEDFSLTISKKENE